MNKFLIILLLSITCVASISFAQSTAIPNSIADKAVVDNKSYMDADLDSVNILSSQIIDSQSDLQIRQQATIALASQNPPLKSATDLCNSNPSSYCPGWVVRNDTTNVNWDAVAQLRASGVNWGDVKAQMTGINWTAVAEINNINWQGIDISSINWENWPNAKSNGENWSQFINNGGN